MAPSCVHVSQSTGLQSAQQIFSLSSTRKHHFLTVGQGYVMRCDAECSWSHNWSCIRPSSADHALVALGLRTHAGLELILEQCVLIELHRAVQDPQRVRNFPRAFKGKVKSASQRRQQQREELAGLLGFAESNACLDSRQITAALRVQNPQLWMEYAQNR